MTTNEQLKRRYKRVLLAGGTTGLAIIFLLLLYQPGYYKNPETSSEIIQQPLVTANTTRVYGKDIYETAVAISQITYPATFDDDKPNAVILVRGDRKEDAIQAARIIHHPNNAPILYIEQDNIPGITWEEMDRLDPQGIFIDGNIKAILVGDIGENVKTKLKKKAGDFAT